MTFDSTPFDTTLSVNGPYFDSTKRRWFIRIVDKNGVRHRVNYARYVWAKSTGTWPTAEEEVDHKDGDKQNDSLDNLQCITKHANKRKYVTSEVMGEYAELKCPACERVFIRLSCTTHLNPANNRTWTACSIVCAHAIRKLYGSIFRGSFEGNVVSVFCDTLDKTTNRLVRKGTAC